MRREILFVEQHGDLGGGQRVILSLATSEAIRARWGPRFALPKQGLLWSELDAWGIPVAVCPAPHLPNGPKRLRDLARFAVAFWPQVRWFRRAVREHSVEFVYTTSPRFLAQLVVACAGTQTRVVFHLQHFYERGWQERFLAAWLGRSRVTLVICPSTAAERWVRRWLAPGKRKVTVPNWLCGALKSAPEDGTGGAVRLDGVTPGAFRFGVVGRLVALKGQDLFLEAARQLLAQGAPAEFYVIGGEVYSDAGGYAARLRAAHADEPRIHFVGHVSRMEGVYPQLSCVVVPSRSEAFGLVAVEAMHHGVPVIVSDVAELPRIVGEGRCGLVVRSGAASELAAAMRQILEDGALRARLAEQGRRQVAEHYLAKPCAGRIADALDAFAREARADG